MSDQPGVTQRAAIIAFTLGCLLFAFAFLANTAAELVGSSLRKRYARW